MAAQRPPLFILIIRVKSVSVSLLGPYWSSHIMAFNSVTQKFESRHIGSYNGRLECSA